MPVPRRRRPRFSTVCWGRIALHLMFALIGLSGCSLAGGAVAAEERWAASSVSRYLLHTVEDVRGQPCAQVVEVHDGAVVDIVSNSCRHPSLWTVEWLFHRARTAENAFHTCALSVRDVGCVCRQRIEADVVYDSVLGFPNAIRSTQVWYPAWQESGFWRQLFQTGAALACAPPAPDPGWTISVRELRPLP